MKKILFITITAVMIGTQLYAQQLPSFALYRDNWNILNPASLSSDYIFSDNNMSLFGSYRNQWLGVDGAPETGILNWEYVMDYFNTVAGANLLYDRVGNFTTLGLYGRFGYRLNMDRRGHRFFNIALSAGIVQYNAEIETLVFAGDAQQMVSNDLVYYPDFGIGLMYYHDEQFYLGVSVPQTFGLETRFRNGDGTFSMKRTQHIYLMGGHYFDLAYFGSSSYLELSGFLKYVPNTPLSLDVNARVQTGEVFWFGLGGGLSKTIRLEAGVILGETVSINRGQLKVGVSFGMGWPEYIRKYGGSLEFHTTYSWSTN